MLIKLDNGNYVNTAFIEQIFKVGYWNIGSNQGEVTRITDADKDRIVKAMVEEQAVAEKRVTKNERQIQD